jgi:hypothetical protein
VAHPLDSRKTVDGEPNPQYNRIVPGAKNLGLCFYGSKELWTGNICDEPLDAKRCPYFTPVEDKDSVLRGFREDLRDASWVQENLPEVAGLLWVLEMAELPRLPWWKRVWCWFLRIQVEPIVVVQNTRLSDLFEGETNSCEGE